MNNKEDDGIAIEKNHHSDIDVEQKTLSYIVIGGYIFLALLVLNLTFGITSIFAASKIFGMYSIVTKTALVTMSLRVIFLGAIVYGLLKLKSWLPNILGILFVLSFLSLLSQLSDLFELGEDAVLSAVQASILLWYVLFINKNKRYFVN